MPYRGPGKLTDMLQNNYRDFSNSGAWALGTQWIQTKHRGFSNSGTCAHDAQLCLQATLGCQESLNPICKTENETQLVQNRLLDSVGKGEGGMLWENSIETSILSMVKQIASPGWIHETSAQGWCTGKTQRDGMGREAGEGIGMGKCM